MMGTHQLSKEQKTVRMNWFRTILARFDGGRLNAVWKIINRDETWVYSFDPETKQQSAQWAPVYGVPPYRIRRERSVITQMLAVFMTKNGHVATVPPVQQRTITRDWWATQCLPKVPELSPGAVQGL
ncbi:unnamed protein product [Echinostoma caproni]|uniref:Transposase n=1 Tax=Echinostoma caproni TaxID=27848 RepID=A0A183AZQ2_9TREM|nr:unnamed protein product [Echinostoma caproni]